MANKNQAVLNIKNILKQSWEKTKHNFWFLVGVLILASLINTVPLTIFNPQQPSLFISANLISALLSLWLSLGVIKIILDMARDKNYRFLDLFLQARLIPKFLISTIIYDLIVFVGFLLLIVPGVIWLIKFELYPYFIVEEDMGPIEALKASSRVTSGDKWNLFLLGLLLLLINIVGFLALLVGMLITYPLSILAMAYAYIHLKKAKLPQTPPEAPEGAPTA